MDQSTVVVCLSLYTIASKVNRGQIAMKFIVTAVVICWTAMCQSQLALSTEIVCHTKSNAFCTDINYTSFATPNFDNDVEEVTIDIKLLGYGILYTSGCSNALVHFLCGYYKPPCYNIPDAEALRLRPCRELCLYVRSSCEPTLKKINATWPDHLGCDQFPLKGDENGPDCYPNFHSLEDYQTRLELPSIPGASVPEHVVTANQFWSPGTVEVYLA